MDEIFVRHLMTENVFAVKPDDGPEEISQLMAEHHVRHVPVVDAYGKLRGIVSHRDLLRHQLDAPEPGTPEAAGSVDAERLMTAPVETVERDTDVRVAAQIMYKHKYGCLPVVEEERLVGILTEADFVRFMC